MSGRIPQHFIDELIARADIVELIGARVPLKKQGKEFKACCPFHGEKTPSFTVVPDKQFYHCFGCGAHGTALGFLMDHDHLSFVEAVEDLAARVGLEVPREDRTPRRAQLGNRWLVRSCSRRPPSSIGQELQAIRSVQGLLQVARPDRRHRRALRLGYAPDAWDFLLKQLGGSEAERLKLLQVGLIIERERKPGAATPAGTTIAFAIA